jgi:hypothetical protein
VQIFRVAHEAASRGQSLPLLSVIAGVQYNQVQEEVVVKERSTVQVADGSQTIINGLRADLTIRGLWEPQEVAFLDVRVVDSDAASFVSQPAMHALTSAEDEKIHKYHDALNPSADPSLPLSCPRTVCLLPRLLNSWRRLLSV